MAKRASLLSFSAFLLAASAAPVLAGSDARALDESGRVLTVGPWAWSTTDSGLPLRVADSRFLGWELRDENGDLQALGAVPGSESLGIDATPTLSRNPATGELWLAWSRQDAALGAREIAVARFADTGWVDGSLQVVAADSDDQLEPVLVHDATGTAWMAWVDGVNSRRIRFMGLASDGRVLGTDDLSDGLSERNGPPNLGIDATGQLFVAFAGTDAATGDVTLFVLTPSPIGGGVSHVPNPIIELGVRADLPAPAMSQATSPDAAVPVPGRVELTVLGGTPVAWWTESEAGQLVRFRYAAQAEAGWPSAQVRAVDLRSGLVTSVPDALGLVEARLRRVLRQTGGGGVGTPVLAPGRTGIGRDGLRR